MSQDIIDKNATGKVAFIGLGIMGWPMAAQLAAAGYDLAVHDLDPARGRAFETEVGGRAAGTAGGAARGAGTVILVLPTSTQVQEVVDLIRGDLSAGTTLIDMTSGSPDVTKAIAADLGRAGVAVIDAPVSGGAVKARTGELAIMIGAEPEHLAKVRPLLETMGTNLHHVGPVGAGQTVKALNNLVFSSGLLIAIEALLIGQRAGVDPAVIVDVLNTSTGGNGATRVLIKNKVLNRSFAPSFALDLMLKDLTIAADLARSTKTTAPYSLLCRETWSAARALLGPGLDNSAIAQYCERLAGDTLTSPSLATAG